MPRAPTSRGHRSTGRRLRPWWRRPRAIEPARPGPQRIRSLGHSQPLHRHATSGNRRPYAACPPAGRLMWRYRAGRTRRRDSRGGRTARPGASPDGDAMQEDTQVEVARPIDRSAVGDQCERHGSSTRGQGRQGFQLFKDAIDHDNKPTFPDRGFGRRQARRLESPYREARPVERVFAQIERSAGSCQRARA